MDVGGGERMAGGDRGQAHTLEGVSAAIVLLASVVFALQVTAVTPLTASTASQHIENQQSGVGAGVLDAAAENGTLEPTVLFYNDSASQFHNVTDRETYSLGGPPTRFGEELNETFLDRGIAFDLTVRYVEADGDVGTKAVVDLGEPSDNAVTVRRSLTLYDDDVLYDADEEETSTSLAAASNFYAPDAGENSPVYNVVQVELTLWRM